MSVSGLTVYPIKSCRGQQLNAAALARDASGGFIYDRHWIVLVRKKNTTEGDEWKMCTQRTHPKMATIDAKIDEAVLAGEREPNSGDCLRMEVDGSNALDVPLCSTGAEPGEDGGAQVHDVRVWGWKGKVVDEGDEAAQWLCAALRGSGDGTNAGEASEVGEEEEETGEQEFRLARFDAAVSSRVVESRYNSRNDPAVTELADGFPILVANEKSANDVNRRTEGAHVAMDRFRANVVVGGDEFGPWIEDTWDHITVSRADEASVVVLSLVKPCARCTVPEVNQDTGEVLRPPPADDDNDKNDEDKNDAVTTVTAALKSLGRSGVDLGYTDRKLLGGLFFGWNALVDRRSSSSSPRLVVRVGDKVVPTARDAGVCF